MYKVYQSLSIMDAFQIGNKFANYSYGIHKDYNGGSSQIIHKMNLDCVKSVGRTYTKDIIKTSLTKYENTQERNLCRMIIDKCDIE